MNRSETHESPEYYERRGSAFAGEAGCEIDN